MYEAEKIKQMSKDIYVYKNELKSMANEYGFYFTSEKNIGNET